LAQKTPKTLRKHHTALSRKLMQPIYTLNKGAIDCSKHYFRTLLNCNNYAQQNSMLWEKVIE
jgi:hypothetical protein